MTVVVNSNSTPEEINTALEALQNANDKEPKKHFNAFKYCGVVDLKEDPLLIQKAMRDEWE